MEQLFTASHLLQFRAERQVTHPAPPKELHVNPVAQHPCEGIGRKENPELQEAQIFSESHLAQLRVEAQATHPIPAVALRVNPLLQTAQTLVTSQRKQFRLDGQSTQVYVVALIVFPTGQRAQRLVISHRMQLLRETGQEMQLPPRPHVKVVKQQPAELAGLMK